MGTTSSLRFKDEVPDYRFFEDPDLPMIMISNERISNCHNELNEVPFEVKRRFCNAFGLEVNQVKVIFKNPWSVEIFERVVHSLSIDPKMVFEW